MRFQRITQAASLTIFVGLLYLAVHPYPDGLQSDFFLRLDPLITVATALVTWEWHSYLLPGVIVLAVTLFFGRIFCGHICPMGTTLDVVQVPLRSKRRPSVKESSYEATAQYRGWKYLLLLFILAAACAGISLVHLGSPLSLVTRLYSLVFYPLLLLVGEAATPLAATLPGLANLQFPQKVFATNAFVFAMFVAIAALARFQPRFWCRNLCPAAALMGIVGSIPFVRRKVSDACNECGKCIRECPTSAILKDPKQTVHSECIVCGHCQSLCPQSAIRFIPSGFDRVRHLDPPDPDRRGILLALGSGFLTAGLLRTGINQPRLGAMERVLVDPRLIRPPGALPEPQFLNRCVRCGECMKACPTNTLQPVWLAAGLEGLFSPVMKPRLAACATNCNACGKVCPTGAIRDLSLPEKQHAKVGTAWIVRQNCLVWEQDKRCLVCDEVCPYKAVSFQPVPDRRNAVPFVIENRCSGCGWCENKCPVAGASAIRVNIIGEVRLAAGSYIEKAQEYGLEFKSRDTSPSRLAPGTFDGPDSEILNKLPPDSGESVGADLPPGFTPK